MTETITLAGCSPTPLASYLKALGILRLVAEQVDPQARGWWQGDYFLLTSTLDEQALLHFLLEDYRPTPILAPWNGGSGFYPKDNTSGIGPLAGGAASRFEALRESIALARRILSEAGVGERPSGAQKAAFVARLRGELGDIALRWLDAAILLADDDPRYPPLLGTGGNDGRLDFTNNFMQRLVDLFDPDSGVPRPGASDHLETALLAKPAPGLRAAAIGQFAPGSAGGPNASSGFSGEALVNSWDFILMLEGAVLFAAAATRRLEGLQGAALSYPFTVRTTGSGTGVGALADEGLSRNEMWLPLWNRPASIEEISGLLSEGRVTLHRRPARDGLDFARAVSALGVERGIGAFQRYAFLMRSGKAYLATPLARVPVRRNRAADLIDQLDRGFWLRRFRDLGRGRDAPARIRTLVRRLEDALFELSADGAAPRVQAVLSLVGQAQSYLRESRSAGADCPDVPRLGEDWLARADDGSPEFSLARALAGIHAIGRRADGTAQREFPMRSHFVTDASADETASERDVTWRRGSLEDNLHRLLRRRLLWSETRDLPDKPLAGWSACNLESVRLWLDRRIDSQRMALLLPGLVLARQRFHSAHAAADEPLPAVFRLLKPLFCTDVQLRRVGLLAADGSLPLSAELVEAVRNGRGRLALAIARRRLRSSGCPLEASNLQVDRFDGPRLLGALLVPLSDSALRHLAAPLRISERQDLATAD